MKIGLKTKLQPPKNVEKDDEICLTCPEKMQTIEQSEESDEPQELKENVEDDKVVFDDEEEIEDSDQTS